MFYSYHIDVQLSHLNKDYLLTYSWGPHSDVPGFWLVAWRSGSVVRRMNEVTLR